MSSAALQQPTSLASLPASPSTRHYHSPQPSPNREAYHANAQIAARDISSSTTRPSSQRPAGNGHTQSSSMSSRTAALAAPAHLAAGPSDQPSPSSEKRRKNMPPVAPPRTSSTQHSSRADPASSTPSRRRTEDRPADSPRRLPDTSLNGGPGTPEDATRSRRHQQLAQEPPQRTSSTRDGRAAGQTTVLPVRTQQQNSASAAATARTPSREASEILNSVVISQPEVDIEREKERLDQAQPHHAGALESQPASPPILPDHGGEDSPRGTRSRHDKSSKREKQIRFGEYILGNTIGEGEFGKVKLGWRQEGGVQVAIKLIKKDQLGGNPQRLQKIRREVGILQGLTHPNIVRLHKMEESERHFGIIMEYASGGELFDYILNHRYLKDNAARRLFAQLVSGVGYLHKRGIVHRDLKLENLLLDRNKNIIITDFGFANTFNAVEDLSEEEELNLGDREWVKSHGLDRLREDHTRKGDLMQTSCGSPCYAAPELVVSDSLYTGRKVDVWSCGVILYAMLAGYLPFDDDPANPEGDNINLLYKYIVNTPLTFPEYVTPHARDLLRRILVPNPRKRADLFEVARHSWLSDYAHVVEFITSSTTLPSDLQNASVPAEDAEAPGMARSASVRESSKKTPVSPTIGGLNTKQGTIDQEVEHARHQKETKRRTVQVEYVAPTTQTQRGEPSTGYAAGGKSRQRSGSEGPVEISDLHVPKEKPLPKDPPLGKDAHVRPAARDRPPPSAHRQHGSRPSRDTRAASDHAFVAGRPTTGESAQSIGSRSVGPAPRAAYGQPLPPEIADTNAHGRIQQPGSYGSPSTAQESGLDYGRPSVSVPPKFARISGFTEGDGGGGQIKSHKRSSTIGEIGGKIFGRSGSLFGKNRKRSEQQPPPSASEKSRKYPPISMTNAMPGGDVEPRPRQSMDSRRSRRSFSLGLGKKRSGSVEGSQTSQEKHTRRFSLIPPSFSKAMGMGRDPGTPPQADSQQELPIQDAPQLDQYGRYVDQTAGGNQVDVSTVEGMYAQLQDPRQQTAEPRASQQQQQQQTALPIAAAHQRYPSGQYGEQRPSAIPSYLQQGAVLNTGSDSSLDNFQGAGRPSYSAGGRPTYADAPLQQQQQQQQQHHQQQPAGRVGVGIRGNKAVLQKNKRFVDAYDTDEYSRPHDHSGSSGPARRVMDFFRRRGKARGGE